MIHISQLSRLPAGQPMATANLAEAVAEGPWSWVRVVTEEFDNSLIDDGAWSCSSVLPVGIGPFANRHPLSGLPLMEAAFIAPPP